MATCCHLIVLVTKGETLVLQIHAMKAYGVYGGERSTSHSGLFTFGKELPFPLCTRLCGPRAVSEERMSSYTCRDSNPGPSRWYDCNYIVYTTQSTIHVSIVKGKDQPMTCLCRHRGEADLQL